MSTKAQALVWDFECPKLIGDVMFKPSHKYVLVSYADHADHHGKNIWPAVATIAKKTGLDDRSVQRLTRDLVDAGLLVEDGQGPRGTNRWKLPYSETGDKLSPVPIRRGDKNADSLSDIPSGDIPSGDDSPPEFKEPEPNTINKYWLSVLEQFKTEMPRAAYESYLKDTKALHMENDVFFVQARSQYARDWLESRLQSATERLLVGIMNQSVSVQFVVQA